MKKGAVPNNRRQFIWYTQSVQTFVWYHFITINYLIYKSLHYFFHFQTGVTNVQLSIKKDMKYSPPPPPLYLASYVDDMKMKLK